MVGEQPLVKQLYGDDRIERQVHPLVNPRREGQQVLAGIAEVLFIHAFAGAVATLVHEPTTRANRVRQGLNRRDGRGAWLHRPLRHLACLSGIPGDWHWPAWTDTGLRGLIGRLTADPELRSTNGGNAVCTIRLAVPRRPRRGEAEPAPVYVNVVTPRARLSPPTWPRAGGCR